MKIENYLLKTGILVGITLIAAVTASAAGYDASTVAVGGYDVVAYHEENQAVKGSGWHAATHEGATYLFANKRNRITFMQAPGKYLPEFGGYCAYGAAVGKKFYADPTVWKIVDGKLYLNLDSDIQNKWESDLARNLEKVYANWPRIKSANPEGI